MPRQSKNFHVIESVRERLPPHDQPEVQLQCLVPGYLVGTAVSGYNPIHVLVLVCARFHILVHVL
eukprot:SAG11_NODE_427_length_9558_cov_4.909398_8_plen_65_part_00